MVASCASEGATADIVEHGEDDVEAYLLAHCCRNTL